MVITELYLQSRALPAQQHFYAELLRVPLRDFSHSSLALQCGCTKVVFWQAPGDEFQGHYHFAFSIPASHLQAAYEWVCCHAAPIPDSSGKDRFSSQSWHTDQVYFFDPAGNIVEFIAYTHDSPQSTTFTGCDILSVCEIGFAVDDVPAAARMLSDQAGLPIYQNSLSDSFAAVGDRLGRIILSRQGRIWFPDTGKPAAYFPLTAAVRDSAGRAYHVDSPPFPLRITPLQTPTGGQPDHAG